MIIGWTTVAGLGAIVIFVVVISHMWMEDQVQVTNFSEWGENGSTTYKPCRPEFVRDPRKNRDPSSTQKRKPRNMFA